MSVLLERPETTWHTHPGWGITVDLTPHEVIQARQLRVHQRLIGLVLVLVLALCIGVSLLVHADRVSAQKEYDLEQARTGQLATATNKYDDITAMQTVTSRVDASLSTVMGPDVDVVKLMARIDAALPQGLTVTNEAVVLSAPPATPGDTTGAATPTGAQIIGSVTLAGTGPKISDINPFVSNLNRVPGVTDVVPTSVTQSETGTDYSITLNLTDELYTGRFAPGGTP